MSIDRRQLSSSGVYPEDSESLNVLVRAVLTQWIENGWSGEISAIAPGRAYDAGELAAELGVVWSHGPLRVTFMERGGLPIRLLRPGEGPAPDDTALSLHQTDEARIFFLPDPLVGGDLLKPEDEAIEACFLSIHICSNSPFTCNRTTPGRDDPSDCVCVQYTCVQMPTNNSGPARTANQTDFPTPGTGVPGNNMLTMRGGEERDDWFWRL